MLKEFKTLFPLAKKYRWGYAAGFLFLGITNAGELYIPQILRTATDVIAQGTFTLSYIANLIVIMFIIALTVAVSRFGWRFFIHGASRKIEKELREKLFNHLLTLSSTFYYKTKTGDIMARATNDMRAIRMASGMALVAFIDGSFLLIAILVILFSQYPKLAFFTILPLPLITIIVLIAGKIVGHRFREVQEGFSKVTEHVQESLSGIRVIKSYVKEPWSINRFKEHNEEYKNRNMRLVRLWGLFFPLVTFISGLTILLLFYFGGTGVIEGTFSPGDFVAFMSYLTMLRWPVMGMGFTVNMLQRGAASLSRINAILNEKPDISSLPGAPKLIATGNHTTDQTTEPLKHRNDGNKGIFLEIRNLSFTYPGSEVKALDSISISIPPGTVLGVVGKTGSGKTTLLRLIPRLIDPPENTILFNGRDVKEYDLSSIRAATAVVPQDTFLFSATLKENIAFGKTNASDNEIEEASQASTISREINMFPKGWDTEVGERGMTLSGGQKQRIAISRALLTEREIALFDDALAAVDTETEGAILKAFLNKRKGKTSIIVSHRVSTLQYADKIILLEQGRLVQQGNHQQLLSQEGPYREIFILQQLENI